MASPHRRRKTPERDGVQALEQYVRQDQRRSVSTRRNKIEAEDVTAEAVAEEALQLTRLLRRDPAVLEEVFQGGVPEEGKTERELAVLVEAEVEVTEGLPAERKTERELAVLVEAEVEVTEGLPVEGKAERELAVLVEAEVEVTEGLPVEGKAALRFSGGFVLPGFVLPGFVLRRLLLLGFVFLCLVAVTV